MYFSNVSLDFISAACLCAAGMRAEHGTAQLGTERAVAHAWWQRGTRWKQPLTLSWNSETKSPLSIPLAPCHVQGENNLSTHGPQLDPTHTHSIKQVTLQTAQWLAALVAQTRCTSKHAHETRVRQCPPPLCGVLGRTDITLSVGAASLHPRQDRHHALLHQVTHCINRYKSPRGERGVVGGSRPRCLERQYRPPPN